MPVQVGWVMLVRIQGPEDPWDPWADPMSFPLPGTVNCSSTKAVVSYTVFAEPTSSASVDILGSIAASS